jgi:cyclase
LSNRQELAGTLEMMKSVRDRVSNLIEEGLDRDQVIARSPSRDFDEAFGGGFVSPEMFVGTVYDGLRP